MGSAFHCIKLNVHCIRVLHRCASTLCIHIVQQGHESSASTLERTQDVEAKETAETIYENVEATIEVLIDNTAEEEMG